MCCSVIAITLPPFTYLWNAVTISTSWYNLYFKLTSYSKQEPLFWKATVNPVVLLACRKTFSLILYVSVCHNVFSNFSVCTKIKASAVLYHIHTIRLSVYSRSDWKDQSNLVTHDPSSVVLFQCEMLLRWWKDESLFWLNREILYSSRIGR